MDKTSMHFLSVTGIQVAIPRIHPHITAEPVIAKTAGEVKFSLAINSR